MIDAIRAIVGPSHVLEGADCAGYSRDWTGVYPSEPLCVVRPANTAEVAAVVRVVADAGGAIVPVGGNTGLVGGTQARGEVMLSLERMSRIRTIKPDARIAVVEAGVVLQSLHDAADAHDLIFPLTFGAKGSARIGGCLSTNAGGSNVVRYGSTRGLCLGLEVVLASGEVLDMMTELHKDNSGYDLRDLFIGAEGTLGIITAAVLKLFPKPVGYATALLSAPDLGAALKILRALQAASGGAVEAFEYMPRNFMQRLAQHRPDLTVPLKTGDCTIMVELGGLDMDAPLAETLASLMEEGLVLDATLAASEAQRSTIWAIREASAEIKFTQLPIVDTDVCVPLEKVALFEAEVQARLAELDAEATDITVAHLGDGNFHYAVYPTHDDPAHLEAVRAVIDGVTVSLGGSISAEHGVGRSQLATLARHKSPIALAVMRQIKGALDPGNVMNPGKVVP
ncbi:FAD-binding oxidoreductase [Thalassobacter stenotrophicus]|uniref:FAD/FMN-containing dehydrogenase n=2 Tax=Thalassobacter stenotrophicus TaxID=266809 RepID=A0ABY1IAS6_9RHOB|nr:FAD-binding oxidoreductase [Thalassobacter stenotrophicus]PVZ49779.1 FAD-binding oxidoreductase [Thalassobacter stenotrophicus]CUH59773.1 putative FAD-linked oxidoreductase [Thalassobacter stenotrophicus]SHI89525.1 FAD/FMN-containing dehydrogenase [Thalassobacter stenotrophicus DSM 16310]